MHIGVFLIFFFISSSNFFAAAAIASASFLLKSFFCSGVSFCIDSAMSMFVNLLPLFSKCGQKKYQFTYTVTE